MEERVAGGGRVTSDAKVRFFRRKSEIIEKGRESAIVRNLNFFVSSSPLLGPLSPDYHVVTFNGTNPLSAIESPFGSSAHIPSQGI